MQSAHPRPILNTSLPAQFRQIRIELARELGHPEGDSGVAYVMIAPLDADDRIDPPLLREHREARRTARLRSERTTTAISSIVRAAAGHSTTTAATFAGRSRISLRQRTFRIRRICFDQRPR